MFVLAALHKFTQQVKGNIVLNDPQRLFKHSMNTCSLCSFQKMPACVCVFVLVYVTK